MEVIFAHQFLFSLFALKATKSVCHCNGHYPGVVRNAFSDLPACFFYHCSDLQLFVLVGLIFNRDAFHLRTLKCRKKCQAEPEGCLCVFWTPCFKFGPPV